MPAALPAATNPSRREAERARRRFARRVSTPSSPSEGAFSPAVLCWSLDAELVVASLRLPAMDAPISTLGPSGPSEAPAPKVTTAAAAFNAGRAAARAPPNQDPSFSPSRFPLASPHLGASSPSKPPARNRRPVTANPAAVGAATAPTACTHVSGRTSRIPST
jgi:hypothetical protein